MTVRRATLSEAPLFERFTRNLYDEVATTTRDPLLTASAESFVANWLSWFQLHVGRETGLVLLGENPEPVGFIAVTGGIGIGHRCANVMPNDRGMINTELSKNGPDIGCLCFFIISTGGM